MNHIFYLLLIVYFLKTWCVWKLQNILTILENKTEYSKVLLCQDLQRAKGWNMLTLKRVFGNINQQSRNAKNKNKNWKIKKKISRRGSFLERKVKNRKTYCIGIKGVNTEQVQGIQYSITTPSTVMIPSVRTTSNWQTLQEHHCALPNCHSVPDSTDLFQIYGYC